MVKASIVIPVRDRAEEIELCLKQLRKSDSSEFEVIVVDDASSDKTALVAARFADKLIRFDMPRGRAAARRSGMALSEGQIIINIDSDVIVAADTISLITGYFDRHPEIDAITGCLSKEGPEKDFFSSYKNLYMNYIFTHMPERVTFLYGSIYAIRRILRDFYDPQVCITDDTEFGQKLFQLGKKLILLKDLEVTHLKKYGFLSLLKNDFMVPFEWARLFISYKGFSQIGRLDRGFAHARPRQISSIIVICLTLPLLAAAAYFPGLLVLAAAAVFIWVTMNYDFFKFLYRERGLFFALRSCLFTFLDNITMGLGAICGVIRVASGRKTLLPCARGARPS